ncbi:MAG: hypothetical protein JRF39_14375 [Deltaproteobacteria bacterium]|nr:hypothetical protein [Deltaproteobacteria bacterium]
MHTYNAKTNAFKTAGVPCSVVETESFNCVNKLGKYTRCYNSRKTLKESVSTMTHELLDNGGRRSGTDRREYTYTSYIPERRSGKERRGGLDRRLKPRTSE